MNFFVEQLLPILIKKIEYYGLVIIHYLVKIGDSIIIPFISKTIDRSICIQNINVASIYRIIDTCIVFCSLFQFKNTFVLGRFWQFYAFFLS